MRCGRAAARAWRQRPNGSACWCARWSSGRTTPRRSARTSPRCSRRACIGCCTRTRARCPTRDLPAASCAACSAACCRRRSTREYLRDLVTEVFDQREDHLWMRAVPREDWDALLRVIGVEEPGLRPARRSAVTRPRGDAARLGPAGRTGQRHGVDAVPAGARAARVAVPGAGRRGPRLHQRHEPAAASPADDGHLEVLLLPVRRLRRHAAPPLPRGGRQRRPRLPAGPHRADHRPAAANCAAGGAREASGAERPPPGAPARSISSCSWSGRRIDATACATCSAAPSSCWRGA